jgi:hypothetical protein
MIHNGSCVQVVGEKLRTSASLHKHIVGSFLLPTTEKSFDCDEATDRRYVSRAILMDLEPGTMDTI